MFGLANLHGKTPTAAIVAAGRYWPISKVHSSIKGKSFDTTTLELFDNWDQARDIVFELGSMCEAGKVPSNLAVTNDASSSCAPIVYSRKVICGGANFYAHVREMGTQEIDKSKLNPFFFLKPPTTAMLGDCAIVPMPGGEPDLDWELELAAVIGKTSKNSAVADAQSIIAGYAIAIDVTARRMQFGGPARFRMDWFTSKSQDGSCPMGPIVPKEFVRDVNDLGMRLSVNGTIKQFSSTADMIFSVDELVAAASQVCTLEPGDVVLTGTPHGVGHPRKDYLKVGDKIDASIDDLGSLRVEIGDVR